MEDPRVVMMIPARGQSKEFPHKCLAMLLGRPLIQWTAAQAGAVSWLAGNWHTVLVSDSQEIAAQVSHAAPSIQWVREPPELARDYVRMEAVMLFVLESGVLGARPDYLMVLQPTSPLRRASDIVGAVRVAVVENAQSVIGVTRTHKFVWYGGAGFAPLGHPKTERPLRQTLPPQYAENGSIYLVQTEAFLREATRFCGRTVPYVMPDWTSQEIDNLADFEAVALILSDRLRHGFDGVWV